MHYLAIAAKKELLPYLPIDWPKTELTELVNPASLAAVVIDEKDSRSRGIYQTMKEKLGLDLPLIEFTPETSPAEISRLAQTYEEANVPRFIRELTAFSDQDDLVFDTPGHHNGRSMTATQLEQSCATSSVTTTSEPILLTASQNSAI